MGIRMLPYKGDMEMRDRVHVEGLRVEVEIGFHPEERGMRQPIEIDWSVETDFAAGPAADAHEGLVDYHLLCEAIASEVQVRRYDLVEALAVDVARIIVGRHPAVVARVRVTKRPPRMAVRSVSAEIVRRASDFPAK